MKGTIIWLGSESRVLAYRTPILGLVMMRSAADNDLEYQQDKWAVNIAAIYLQTKLKLLKTWRT